MNKFFAVGVCVVIGLLLLGGYWYQNPHLAPSWLRYTLPEVNLPSSHYPVTRFR